MKTVIGKLFILSLLLVSLVGCAGTIIETATDAAVAVAKVPFKVGGAVVDAVTDDEEEENP